MSRLLVQLRDHGDHPAPLFSENTQLHFTVNLRFEKYDKKFAEKISAGPFHPVFIGPCKSNKKLYTFEIDAEKASTSNEKNKK